MIMAGVEDGVIDWMLETSYDDHGQVIQSTAEDGGTGQVKPKRRGVRRHKSQFMKKPMAMSEIILELQDSEMRENALRCLSGHLIEKRQIDIAYYRNAGYLLYYSCSTLAILIQEVILVYHRFYAADLNIRGSKRLANVLTLFQSIASNEETRIPCVRGAAYIPNLLLPFVLSTYTEEVYENIRAISLSVFDLLCKEAEHEVIHWAVNSDIIPACLHTIEIGSRLSKVMALSILESILRDHWAREVICEQGCTLAMDIIMKLSDLVAVLGVVRDFSPRLVFHVIRSYILLCQHPRALELVKENFPQQLQDHTFHDLKKVYPLLRVLQHQLLLVTAKVLSPQPRVTPDSEANSGSQSSTTGVNSSGKGNISYGGGSNRITPPSRSSGRASPNTPTKRDMPDTPLRPVNLNKEDWSRPGPSYHVLSTTMNIQVEERSPADM